MVKNINFADTIKIFIKKQRLSWRFTFAHHPICPTYKSHYWEIKGLYLCQGCSLVYAGFLSALSFLVFFQISLTSIHYLFVGLGVLIPILLLEMFKLEQRTIKRLSRAGIGIGVGVSFSAFFLHEDIVVKVIGLLVTIIGFMVFKQVRKTAKKDDLCRSCPEYRSKKICRGLRFEAEAMRKYSDYASDLLQIELKEKFTSKLDQEMRNS